MKDKTTYLTAQNVPRLQERKRDSHKGDYGRVLLIGGSFGMSGAIALAGRAALVTGSGLVRLAVPERSLPMVASHAPELMTVALPENRSGKISLDAFSQIMALAEEADVVVIGPGLGRSAGLDALVMRLYREVPRPMLIDADGLNALASHSFDRMAESFAQVAESGAWRILTPHPGEFARLVRGQGAGDREPTVSPANISERVVAAREFVTQQNARTEQKCSGEVRTKTPGQCLPTGVPIGGIQTETPSNSGIQTETPGNTCGIVLVLKGCETVVTDGEQIYVNTSGNPGMATAGSGDVLSGMIASLIGQRLSPMDAAKLGVWLHGRSADLALEISHTPHESITASTLIDHIGSAVWEWNAGVASS